MFSATGKQAAAAEYKQELADAAVAYAGVAASAPDASSAKAGSVGAGAVSAKAGPSNAECGPALAANSEVPRLPREFETSVGEPHREKNAWHPTGCIARKLSKKEMDACPKALQSFGCRMKLRFLKRPHPTKGVGAWDDGERPRGVDCPRRGSEGEQDSPRWKDCRTLPRAGKRVGGGRPREEDEGSLRTPW